MLKKLMVTATIIGIASALVPVAANAAPGADSMTSCVITDGTTTLANFPLNVYEGGDPSTATVTMVPTPGTGKWLFSDNGFVNKSTNWAS